ncbi:unnamed protein product [Pocillopora meandrina]|uniref:Uncharacterized protein n=1 Tax=Pocillopora meandrina TaxID=46732 RepID=A0AAU9Y7Q2_9CNID|nr:unnamed protein product [Pocillopora meandrina]CAH3168381.1 unnamed protein product [Pocillopora meandrina]
MATSKRSCRNDKANYTKRRPFVNSFLHREDYKTKFCRLNLQVLQNKAAKLVLDKPLYSSATDALNQLGWLNLKQRRHFHRCLYVYKCVNGTTSNKLELSRNSNLNGTEVNKEPVIMP